MTVPEESARPHYRRAAVVLILLGTAFHLLYSTHLELVGDEAYYWLWSRHPDISYLEKGPMIAWLIAAGTTLFGQSVFGIRFFAPLLGGGTGIAVFVLARQLFCDRVAFWAVALVMVGPLNFVGASLMTVDTIYIFFWAWAAVAFWRAKDETRLRWWALTGAGLGLGMLSKYTAAAELLSFAAFCLWHRPSRAHLRRPTFWTMIGVALLFVIPAIVWNFQHHWPTSDWMLQRGALDKLGGGIHPLFVVLFLGEQAAVLSPLLFFGVIFACLRSALRRTLQPATGYAVALFFPLFGFYFLLSLHYRCPPNWPAAAYIGGVILLAAEWTELAGTRRWARWAALGALALAAIETAILLETGWLHLPQGRDPLDRARGWRNLAASVSEWQQHTGASFVIADNYMTASLLSFYLPGQPETFVFVSTRPLDQMELWPSYMEKHRGEDALIVCKKGPPLPRPVRKTFDQVASLGPVEVMYGDRKVGRYHLYLGRRNAAR